VKIVEILIAVLCRISPEVYAIIGFSLLYLVYDLYPSVKSFRAMLNTVSFLLLWLYFAIVTGIAYGFLMTSALSKVESLVGVVFTKLTIFVIAALMAATVLQSLSLKIADVKIVNVQTLIENYRTQVLADILKKSAQREKLKAFHLGDRLSTKFRNKDRMLQEAYADLLTFSGRSVASIGQEIAHIQADATTLNISPVRLIAGRIVRLDSARARQLLS